jgi:hypothetical protein
MRQLKASIWPFTVKIYNDNTTTVDDWCKENLGHRFNEWYSYNDGNSGRKYAFKDERTLLVFKLRWNSKG